MRSETSTVCFHSYSHLQASINSSMSSGLDEGSMHLCNGFLGCARVCPVIWKFTIERRFSRWIWTKYAFSGFNPGQCRRTQHFDGKLRHRRLVGCDAETVSFVFIPEHALPSPGSCAGLRTSRHHSSLAPVETQILYLSIYCFLRFSVVIFETLKSLKYSHFFTFGICWISPATV